MTPARSLAQGHPGAVAGLLGRYASVFAHAWRGRAQLAGLPRSEDELAFLPAALSLQDTPVHPAPRRAAVLLMALFAAAIAWAILGRVDIVAVAPGRIIVSERTKLVQPLERSVVKRVLVKDGDHVLAGQALVELDPTSAHADKTSVQEQLKSARSDVARARSLQGALHDRQGAAPAGPALVAVATADADQSLPAMAWSSAERRVVELQLAAEWSDIAARLARIDAETARRRAEITTAQEMVAKLDSTLPLIHQREQDLKALSAQGFIASHAGQDRTRERIEMERDLATQRARLLESVATLRESETTRTAYLAETRRGLSERQAQAELRLQQSRQEHAKAVQRERLTVLSAPVSGVVQQLATHTAGGVVTEAQPLMVIVPEGAHDAQVVVEVTLENKDIGFVNTGQAAQIKLETFVFTRYGTVPATVQLVTADAVNDDKRGAIFPARLVLARNHIAVDGKQIRLSPGMNVTAEIKIGQRRVIEYLLSPIQRMGSEGLRER